MKIHLLLLTVFFAGCCYGQPIDRTSKGRLQKVGFSVGLTNPNAATVSAYLFSVKLKNTGFDQYWVQDTTYLINTVEDFGANLIYPLFWKKRNGKYVRYENLRHRPGILPVKYLDSCYSCIVLHRGDSLTFTLRLQDCCNFETGEYKMIVYLHPPLGICKGCVQLTEIESNYLYFTVGMKKVF